MEALNLDTIVRDLYDKRVLFLRAKNMELEREYFTKNNDRVPLNELMQGASFEDHFITCKETAKTANEEEANWIFTLLQEYFLFSVGYDMMFKKKLEADIFNSVPIEALIYPRLLAKVKEKYNDVSVMKENPNFKSNIEDIDRIIYTFTELQSLLWLLYCYDFQFPKDWEGLFSDTHEDIIAILEKSGMTIGEFLHALIDFKCGIMENILKEIGDPKIREEYLKKLQALKEEKHAETKTFTHVNLPVTYFLNHTFIDFLKSGGSKTSPLDEDPAPQGKTILLQ